MLILLAVAPMVLLGACLYPIAAVLLLILALGAYAAYYLVLAIFSLLMLLIFLTNDAIEKVFGHEAKRAERRRSFSNWAALYRVPKDDCLSGTSD